MFSKATVTMASVEEMEKYVKEARAGKGKEKRNQIIRSWNGVMDMGKSQLDGDVVFLVDELTEIDLAFTTHFKDGKLFMTTAESWCSMWEQYVETLERYVNNVAQRGRLTAEQEKTADQMIGKLKFVMTGTDEPTTMPPLPLMTRGVLTAMVQSIREVSGALREVSNDLFCTVLLDV